MNARCSSRNSAARWRTQVQARGFSTAGLHLFIRGSNNAVVLHYRRTRIEGVFGRAS
jgi:hypothetical protein